MTFPAVVPTGIYIYIFFFSLNDQRVHNKKKEVPYQEVGLALGDEASLKAEKAALITN